MKKPLKKSRVFLLHEACNAGKLVMLGALQVEYSTYVAQCVALMIERHCFNLLRSEKQAFFLRAERLSSQIEKNARDHAIGIVSGWAASAYTNLVKSRISELKKLEEIDGDTAKALYIVGKHQKRIPDKKVTQEHLDRYWSLLLDATRPPRVTKRIGIRMSEMTATLEEATGAKVATIWLTASTLTRYQTMALPLEGNPYVTSLDDIGSGILARQDARGRWRFEVVEKKTWDPVEPTDEMPKIGIDVGLNVIAATSDGRAFGGDLKPVFDTQYSKVKRLRANRQRQGLREDSSRLARMEQRLSGLTKSAVGRVSNELIQAYPGHVLVVEDLDLSGCRGSKRFCYRALHHSLEGKTATFAVNPAYTSQTCPCCGWFSRSNRRGVEFHCVRCGYRGHADVVGAMGVLGRSESKQIHLDDNPVSVREVLVRLYWERRNPNQDCPRDFLKKCHAPVPSGRRLTTRVSPLGESQAQPQKRPSVGSGMNCRGF